MKTIIENGKIKVQAVPKGKKEVWQAHAANRGMSLTKLITSLVENDMNKT